MCSHLAIVVKTNTHTPIHTHSPSLKCTHPFFYNTPTPTLSLSLTHPQAPTHSHSLSLFRTPTPTPTRIQSLSVRPASSAKKTSNIVEFLTDQLAEIEATRYQVCDKSDSTLQQLIDNIIDDKFSAMLDTERIDG